MTLRSATGQQLVVERFGVARFAGELEQGPDRGEKVVQVVRHAARHLAEQVEFLRLQDLRLQADLVHDQAHALHQRDEQADVVGGELFAGLFADEEQAEDFAFRGQREAKLARRRTRSCSRACRASGRVARVGIVGVQRQVFALVPLEILEDRRLRLEFRALPRAAAAGCERVSSKSQVRFVAQDDAGSSRARRRA